MVLTKAELIACLQKEIHILLHLCGKVEPSMVDYRPTAKQRSVLELLQYLTLMGPVLVRSVRAGEFLAAEWTEAETAAKQRNFEATVAELAKQSAGYAEWIGAMSDEELRGEIEMFGNKSSRGATLVNMIVCGHAAYRTQLFCYLKACGREELNTMNLWAGVDAPM